jgi:predicted dehydrogenase
MTQFRRRELLKGAAAGGLAAQISSCQTVPETLARESTAEVRVAVVGLNGRGNGHASELRRLPNVKLVALCDVDEKILAKRKAEYEAKGDTIETYTNFKDLIAREDIDAVSIATPNHWHSLQGIWACQAGKDVYVEKPVSHNIWEGRQLVRAARKYKRICQAGTQSRSHAATREAINWIHSGNLGKVLAVHGMCYKPRQSIGQVTGATGIPATIDYERWTGPAPMKALMRKRLHYDWHWDSDTGNGDVGNQGVHQMDVARWIIGESELPPRVLSVGGRLGYEDDGDTPNTQVAMLDFDGVPLIFEVRGLPKDKASQSAWGANMDRYMGSRIGVVAHCEGGWIRFDGTGGPIHAYDNDDKELRSFSGGGVSHFQNFIDCVRSRKSQDLNGEILEGHLSSACCHMGVASHTLGEAASKEEIRAAIAEDHPHFAAAVERMIVHLEANEVDLLKTPLTLGRRLELDPSSESFIEDEEAAELVDRDYRRSYRVPLFV